MGQPLSGSAENPRRCGDHIAQLCVFPQIGDGCFSRSDTAATLSRDGTVTYDPQLG